MSKIYTKDHRHIFFDQSCTSMSEAYINDDRKYNSEKMSKLMGNGQMYNVLSTVT